MERSAPLLQLKSVSKIYGSGQAQVRAVDSVDLSVSPGEIVLIMGPSGSGKTTLLSLAGGLLGPSSGEVAVAGQTLSSLNAAALAQLRLHRVGFVFQAFNLLASLTALENVAVVMNLADRRGAEVEARAARLLAELGLEQRANHLPGSLSGGEKQRVALANDPPLTLADEPTGNLDSHTGREVMMLLFDLAKEGGKGVVVVSHDLRITEIADRVLWLEDGLLDREPHQFEEKVRDLVCGMQLELKDVAFFTNYRGHVYYFDREKCRQKFLADPEAYISG